ncbi:related to Putative sterigmatocystin biosynthesis lipase/esterase STCI [Ramularia collo-cygni]|uniref:Related to Putative sterigmatocystin biosynthesis lipase/esterase STCI n=1 Tax=Ramularia collo-cygni TaxID=112498 RepID=A0A2D3VLE6_9PEZI|nr:related to Putative sterigmatocystin biosynthesis lipase/esterase STCI [Ramularia collo-cygni]CZT23344.1 related to Putative sterigmatocystin biosynthesis lipase/esterase STCI [Ramularia collo-cygni]
MSTIESIKKLSEPNEEFAAFLKATPLPRPDWRDFEAHKKTRHETEQQNIKALGPPPPEVQESFSKIAMRDGFDSELKIFKPTNPPSSGSPLVILIFGGGFVVGSNGQMTAVARQLTKVFGATVVNISYRLAPEHKFPTGVNDAWDSVQWIAANASSLGADPSKGFIVGGVSAGANITAVIAQKYLDEGISPPMTGLWLSVPLLFSFKENVPEKYRDQWFSREQNKDAPVLDGNALDAIWDHLAPDTDSEWFSPYNGQNPHKGLPPTYLQVDGLDPLRDDGLIHEQVLRNHGVKTKLTVWPGLPHAHFAFFPMLKCGKLAVIDTFEGLGWLLGKIETA